MSIKELVGFWLTLCTIRAAVASGKQPVLRFPNGYGASVIPMWWYKEHGTDEQLYEVATVKHDQYGEYTVTDEVENRLTLRDVGDRILKIKAL